MQNNEPDTMTRGRDIDAQYIRDVLRGLRRSFVRFDLGQTALWWLALLLLGTMTVVTLDMYIHLPCWLRWCALGTISLVSAAGGGIILYVLLRPPGDPWLAVRIEQHYPVLKNRLITCVQILRAKTDDRAPFDPEFTRRLLAETRVFMERIDGRTILPWRTFKLPASLVAAALLVLGVVYLSWPEGCVTAMRRLLEPNAVILAPARTLLLVTPTGATVAKGDSLNIAVDIRGATATEARLHIRRPAKNWTVITMRPDPLATNAWAPRFLYDLLDVQNALEYFISAGDAESPVYAIKVLERPRIRSIAVHVEFPEYLGLPPHDAPADQPAIEAPIGSRATLTIETDAPIAGGAVKLKRQNTSAMEFVPLTLTSPQQGKATLTIAYDGTYTLLVTNSVGLGEKIPPEYPIIAQADLPPLVEITEPARDLTLDTAQSVPVVATARDDFGLKALYYDITTNASVTYTNLAGHAMPGTRIADIATAGIRTTNTALQIDLKAIPGFEDTGCLAYTFFAVDRKGQVGQSKTYLITLATKQRERDHANLAMDLPWLKSPETTNTVMHPDVARLEQLIRDQERIQENVHAAWAEAKRRRPDAEALPAQIQAAFDQQKNVAGKMATTRAWAQQRLDELAKNKNITLPAYERALRATEQKLDALRTHDVASAMENLRDAFLGMVPQGTNAAASIAPPPANQPPAAANVASLPPTPQPRTPAAAPSPATATPPGSKNQQPQQAQQQQSSSSPTASTPPTAQPPTPATEQRQPPAATPEAMPQSPSAASSPTPATPSEKAQPDMKAVADQLKAAENKQEKIIDDLKDLKERMSASLPGQVDEAKLAKLDDRTKDQIADTMEQFKEGLKLAAEKLEDASQKLNKLQNRQSDLRGKTMETDAEQIKNLAPSQDRLALDTGHAEERMREKMPWLSPPENEPQEMTSPLESSTPPRVPIPPAPPAPRKEVMEGPEAPMPTLTQPPGENPQPKLLVPDRFPSEFRGKLSDKPIPPPVVATPTGRAPSTSLKKMTDEEKERLRKESLLDSLEISDDGKAAGIGAPAHEEMPEEMKLEPGAQYSSGPSAPDSKPGMELGQSAAKVMGNPQQPPAGGGGGSPSESPSGQKSSSSQPPNPNNPKNNSPSSPKSSSSPAGQPSPSSPSGAPKPPPSQSSPSPASTPPAPSPGQSSPPAGAPPSSPSGQPPSASGQPSSAQGSPSAAGGGAFGQPAPGQPGSPMPPGAAQDMKAAAQALEQSDRSSAVSAQDQALAELKERQADVDQIQQAFAGLQGRLNDVMERLSDRDATQAEILNSLEQALNDSAWGEVIQDPSLSDTARSQLSGMRGALAGAYMSLGGTAVFAQPEAGGKMDITTWAKYRLPPHLQQELVDGLRERGPAAYQEILEAYFRSIANEK